jgi:two-component system cell cycle response regulator DivK
MMVGDRILVVEDNDRSMKLLRDVLQATGYRTLEAATGEQALSLAATQGPALVLMDIRLPDMSGIEVLSRLRMHERTARVPVLAVTAEAMKGDLERLLEAGFDGYLSKPVDLDELLTAVELHCRGRAV